MARLVERGGSKSLPILAETRRCEGKRGFTDVVLLGMGGSSWGPKHRRDLRLPVRLAVVSQCWTARFLRQIKAIESAVDLGKSLFFEYSKSGCTLEPNILMDYFLDRVGAMRGQNKAGEHFVAVTDAGSSLERRAKILGFAHTPSMACPRLAGVTPCCRSSGWYRRRRSVWTSRP